MFFVLGALLACSSDAAAPTELSDTLSLCRAVITCSDCDDDAQDAALQALHLGTPWGEQTRQALSEGAEISPAARQALVEKIRSEGGSANIDCAMLEAFWAPE